MIIDFLLERFAQQPAAAAFDWKGDIYSYGWLHESTQTWMRRLGDIPSGVTVSLESDFSPNAVACLLALIELRAIVVPMTRSVAARKSEFKDIAEVVWSIDPDKDDCLVPCNREIRNELLLELGRSNHPGLVLFSSGSTGASKAALHDVSLLLEKFHAKRRTLRTIPFLLFDHIGGFNTLFYSLSNLGLLVFADSRTPDDICALIDRSRVELLPTSPTFLNLLLVSRAYQRHDLSSLSLVTYGTEPMPEQTLKRLRESLPWVQLKQTYGLSEVGILASQSKSSDSLWMKLGGEGFETRVVDGCLEIKAVSAMIGYLNAPSPFTEDGWFKTGDAVELEDEYVRVLGRDSELINVGGQKVYPSEIEGCLEEMDGVLDAVVWGEPHPLIGQIVVARVRLSTDESLRTFRSRARKFVSARLEDFKVPQKVILSTEDLHNERFKKTRLVT